MRIAGIVVEYNPFHNGHLHQIQTIKRTLNPDAIIVIMSGQFTQRGTPCITDKHTRARMAIANGVDIVLELPVPFATASAEMFARGAISALHKTGIVTDLSFGSETPDSELFHKVAHILLNEPDFVSYTIKTLLNTGISYPVARQQALIQYLSTHTAPEEASKLEALLSSPNNILGIEYTKALLHYASPIKPRPILRQVAHYHDTTIEHTIASATAIRQHLLAHDLDPIHATMPYESARLLMAHYEPIVMANDLSDLLQYKLIFAHLDDLYALWDIPRNLCESIMNASRIHHTIDDIIDAASSKTYTRATVSRAILRILLGISDRFMKDLLAGDCTPYIRVLACHKDAKPILAQLCKKATVPVITQFKKGYDTASPLARQLLDLEIAASRLYALKKHDRELAACDFTRSIFSPPNTP